MFVYLIITTSVLILDYANGHGNLMNPPSRNSLWRFDKQAPINYDDNGLNCGGLDVNILLFFVI